MTVKNRKHITRVQEPFGHIIQLKFPFLPEQVLKEILEICSECNDPHYKRYNRELSPCDMWCPHAFECHRLFNDRMENSDADPVIKKSFESWVTN